VFGGTYPAQIWSRFMRSALDGTPPAPLFDPEVRSAPTTTVPAPDGRFLEPLERPTPDDTVTVPAVEGLELSAAGSRLRSAGLRTEIFEISAAGAAPGTVLVQSPGPGGTVSRGSTVRLEATAPPPTTTTTSTTTSTVAPPPTSVIPVAEPAPD
jgi:membrane peptidoglycan carboxypeptidase